MRDPNRRAWEGFAGRHRASIPLDFAPALKPVVPPGPLLDLGCGYGRVMSYAIDSGWSVAIGVDYSPTMLSRARAAGHRLLVLAQADRLPFASNTFSAVVSIATLSSLAACAQRERAIREIARVLLPDGVLFVRDFALTLTGWRLARYVTGLLRFRSFGDFQSVEGIRFHHFRQAEIAALTAAADLSMSVYSRETFSTMYGRASNGFTMIARKQRITRA
jgi:ubiquinone/menaquinone biosynthesis C-methylase UbiE